MGELSIVEAARLMKLSERQAWRLKKVFQRVGPAAVVHGNRGRASPRRLAEETRARIVELASTRYVGINDCHLAEEEAIVVSRVAVRRILRAAGRPSARRAALGTGLVTVGRRFADEKPAPSRPDPSDRRLHLGQL